MTKNFPAWNRSDPPQNNHQKLRFTSLPSCEPSNLKSETSLDQKSADPNLAPVTQKKIEKTRNECKEIDRKCINSELDCARIQRPENLGEVEVLGSTLSPEIFGFENIISEFRFLVDIWVRKYNIRI